MSLLPLPSIFRSKFNVTSRIYKAANPNMSLACNIYNRKNTPKNASSPTILFAHANGFHKELWEPVIGKMDDRWTEGDLYAFDCRNQGDSAVLNKEVLEKTFNWYDYAKDMLAIIDTDKIQNPIGIGHSFGATAMILLEMLKPGTFSVIVAIEPTMFPFRNDLPIEQHPLAQITLKRRDHWESREDAKEKLLKSKFFQAWDPESLDHYLHYGMIEVTNPDGTNGITLKCPKYQEAATFAAVGGGISDGFHLLDTVNTRIHVITGGKSDINLKDLLEQKMNKIKYGSLDVIEDAGHLVPQERPTECAKLISNWLNSHFIVSGRYAEMRARL